MVVTAALVVAYTALLISGVNPPLPDVVFTTWPSSPLASSVGTNTLMPLTTPITLTSSDHRQSLTWCSQIWPSEPDPMPALLHTTCTAPNASSVASRSASTDSSDVTSVTTPIDVATLVAQLGRRLLDQRGHDVGDAPPSCPRR